MQLSKLIIGLDAEQQGAGDPLIRGICSDSRATRPGDLFVALRGDQSDGHAHTGEAARLGAVALLLEDASGAPPLPCALVKNTRRALAPVAARFFGEPARELTLIGVTGTNGKTSVSFLVESVLRQAGRNPGLIGTVAIRYAEHSERATNTTPESLEVQRTLRAMRSSGVNEVVMEVSSHGLALGRVEGCRFRVAAFTNLSRDHLDFHESMDSYRDAKLRLFEHHLARDGCAVINCDDAQAGAFLDAARARGARVLRVSRFASSDAELRLRHAELSLEGTRAVFALPDGDAEVQLPLPGDFNLDNALLATGICIALGVPRSALLRGLACCPPIPGRIERIFTAERDAPSVLVDYAHTPDAMDKLLRTLRPLSKGRLITVFGCGGDRDRGKRRPMAEAAARSSDYVVATSDNPRCEDAERILDELAPGLAALQQVEPGTQTDVARSWTRLSDRREAIAHAIAHARSDDTVVIAGKGHEDYQIIGSERLPFDDREEARRALAARGLRT